VKPPGRPGAEQRLKALGLKLPAPPEPVGTYVEAVQTGKLLFLSGMLPTEGHQAKVVGRVGAELGVEAGRKAVGIGHNLPQEAPHAFAQAVVDVDGYVKRHSS
jgi:hypothetical protein